MKSSFILCAVVCVLSHIALGQTYVGSPGDLDPAFGVGGKTTIQVGTGNEQAFGLALQTDGKILLAGSIQKGTTFDAGVVRLNANGTLDNTFGTLGKQTVDFNGAGGNDRARGVAVQNDGKVIVVGTGQEGAAQKMAAYRFTSRGILDVSFRGTGKSIIPSSTAAFVAESVALDGNRIVTCGGNMNMESIWVVNRTLATGFPDRTFNATGETVQTFGFEQYRTCKAVMVQADRKVLSIGYGYGLDANADFLVSRQLPNGLPDTTFGTKGKKRLGYGDTYEQFYEMALQPNGKILGVGAVSGYRVVVVRLNSNGTPDTSFNGTGKTQFNVGAGDSFGEAIGVHQNGKILVSSRARVGSNLDYGISRLMPNGTLDSSFGQNGSSIINFNPQNDEWTTALAVQGNRILIAGWTNSNGTNQDFAIARLIAGEVLAD